MSSKLRVALIGCGAISGNHLGGILAAGETLCALCDVDVAKAEEKAAAFDLKDIPVYADYLQMLDAEKPDVVHICTPHYLHSSMAEKALLAGKDVLLEKPVCLNAEDFEKL